MEALENGYDEGIALDYSGLVSEGSGENLFLVKDKVIYTPTLASSALLGITRDTIIAIAKDLGYEVKEQSIPREFLYIADEVFLTGTAAEVTPVASIDKIKIGENSDKPITKEIQAYYFDVVKGKRILKKEWLIYVK
jgi:branched-chain amino acid aminotransferase